MRRDLVAQREHIELLGRTRDPHARTERGACSDLGVGVERETDLERLAPSLLVERENGEHEVAHDRLLVIGLHDQEVEVVVDRVRGNDGHL